MSVRRPPAGSPARARKRPALPHSPGRNQSNTTSPLLGGDGGAVRLHALEMGRGPTIVFLHGLGGSTYTWRKVMPALSVTHRVVAIDLKGFANPKLFDTAYSAADQRHWLSIS